MKLVKANDILGTVVDESEQRGVTTIEYFEGVDYRSTQRMIVCSSKCKEVESKYNIGDEVVSNASGKRYKVVGYSGTYGSGSQFRLAVVLSNGTWLYENEVHPFVETKEDKLRKELEELKAYTRSLENTIASIRVQLFSIEDSKV